MDDVSKRGRERVEAVQREAMEACPVELRPALERVHKAFNSTTQAHEERVRNVARQRRLREALETGDGADTADAIRNELVELDAHYADIKLRSETLGRTFVQTGEAFEECKRQWRVRLVPESKRTEALALLEKERTALLETGRRFRDEGQRLGTILRTGMAAQAALNLEQSKDEEETERLTSIWNESLAAAQQLDEQRIAFKQECEAVKTDFERHLQAMIDGVEP